MTEARCDDTAYNKYLLFGMIIFTSIFMHNSRLCTFNSNTHYSHVFTFLSNYIPVNSDENNNFVVYLSNYRCGSPRQPTMPRFNFTKKKEKKRKIQKKKPKNPKKMYKRYISIININKM